ncbi:putative abductin-like protein [Enhygromyxa salina]|uniref:Putative abductin-like protein n=1 Tax=Enhygromyxa salina TaxID=215803 RepID=A0A0C2CPH2_9BACT|nr:putative abductin-like protein [Enhygromyxa salina]
MAPEPQIPRWARVSATFTLHADPSASVQQLMLGPGLDGATQRIVELVDARDGWTRVRTVLPRQAVALGFDSSMGVAILELEGWLPSTQLFALEPAQERAVSVPLPAGESKSGLYSTATGQAAVQASVAAGVLLRWPDGRVAGRVAEAHRFYAPATTRSSTGPDGGPLDLACHEHRSARGLGEVQGWLCSEAAEVVAPEDRVGVTLDRPPTPEPAGSDTDVQGALDRDIIRRIVRAHINEIRGCYNHGLLVNPDLEGRVAINFVIGGNGSVKSAVVAQDNLPDPSVGQCMAKAVARWKFPKPRGGGNVTVLYPFNLTPG